MDREYRLPPEVLRELAKLSEEELKNRLTSEAKEIDDELKRYADGLREVWQDVSAKYGLLCREAGEVFDFYQRCDAALIPQEHRETHRRLLMMASQLHSNLMLDHIELMRAGIVSSESDIGICVRMGVIARQAGSFSPTEEPGHKVQSYNIMLALELINLLMYEYARYSGHSQHDEGWFGVAALTHLSLAVIGWLEHEDSRNESASERREPIFDALKAFRLLREHNFPALDNLLVQRKDELSSIDRWLNSSLGRLEELKQMSAKYAEIYSREG